MAFLDPRMDKNKPLAQDDLAKIQQQNTFVEAWMAFIKVRGTVDASPPEKSADRVTWKGELEESDPSSLQEIIRNLETFKTPRKMARQIQSQKAQAEVPTQLN